MIVEMLNLICIKDIFCDRLGKFFQVYQKDKEYRFVRVNEKKWMCRDDEVLKVSLHTLEDDYLHENFKSKEDIRELNILEIFSK